MVYDPDEFAGKRILVTGGTRGIGEATVNRLSLGGGKVLSTARTIPPGADPERFIQSDVSTRTGADHVIKATIECLGGLDILINSVGGSSAPGGIVLAVDSTLPPPSNNRFTVASPIPLVPPVTRIRLPANSFGSYAIMFSFRLIA